MSDERLRLPAESAVSFRDVFGMAVRQAVNTGDPVEVLMFGSLSPDDECLKEAIRRRREDDTRPLGVDLVEAMLEKNGAGGMFEVQLAPSGFSPGEDGVFLVRKNGRKATDGQ